MALKYIKEFNVKKYNKEKGKKTSEDDLKALEELVIKTLERSNENSGSTESN